MIIYYLGEDGDDDGDGDGGSGCGGGEVGGEWFRRLHFIVGIP